MKTRDEIFDDINEYEHNLSGLIADLRSVGITSYAAFDEAADEVMAQVKRTIREYVAANIGREVPPPPPPPSPGPVPPPLPSNNQDESVWNIAQIFFERKMNMGISCRNIYILILFKR